ncbi:2-alkenal reductase (NADP(+)-dependent)-like [Lycium ferocissimum]|uniref:2-alkenal reductase (NADP(+)-dependent)-like n=1 Tax=Lycium ferocissimum TaxID=112874 RepID=UPI002814FC17|nr:2-alkenal reductase (NADP(+)-dependent)-like [Lycium ferocissimum]
MGKKYANKQVLLKSYVEGNPSEDDFELKMSYTSSHIPHGSNAVFLKNIYLACDPALRFRLSADDLSDNIDLLKSFNLGSVIEGFGVAKVIKSTIPDFEEGNYVWGVVGWEEYSMIENPKVLFTIKYTDVPLSYYVGILGMVGLTAYFGINNMSSVKAGEVVYKSTAAGGVGLLAGQFAKMMNCYVVGSTSTDEKVDLLKNKLGFDDAFNYKKEDLGEALKRVCPNGIDVYFENVGGAMLDEVILHMKSHGRIAVCGMISQYGLKEKYGIQNLFHLITKCIRMEGFSANTNYWKLYPQYLEWAIPLIRDNKIVYFQDIAKGLESAPAAFTGIFHGKNIGKAVVKIVADE